MNDICHFCLSPNLPFKYIVLLYENNINNKFISMNIHINIEYNC